MRYKVVATMLVAGLAVLVALVLVSLFGLAMYQSALAGEVAAPTPTRELRPTFTPTPVPTPVVDRLPEAGPAPAAPDALMSAWTEIQISKISIPTARVHGADVHPVEYDPTVEAWARSDLGPGFPAAWDDKLPRGALISSPEAEGSLWVTSHRGVWSAAGPLDSLDQVETGDWVRVTDQDGRLIHLQVVERYSRIPNGEPMTQLIQPTGQLRLVVYTCTPDGEAAVVVIAEPKLVGELPSSGPVEGNRGLVIPKAGVSEIVETLGEISQAPNHRFWSYPNERGGRVIFSHREMMAARQEEVLESLEEGDLIYLFPTLSFDGPPLQLRVTGVEVVETGAGLYRALDRVKYDLALYALVIQRAETEWLVTYAEGGAGLLPAPPTTSTEGWAGIQITSISIPTAGLTNELVHPVVPLGTGAWVLAGHDEPTFAPIWEVAVPGGIVASLEDNGTVRMWGHRWTDQAKTESGVLANLDQVAIGDLVAAQGKNGELVYLQVTERYDQVPYSGGVTNRLLRSNEEPQLAIYTCTRYDGFAVVVVAKPLVVTAMTTQGGR